MRHLLKRIYSSFIISLWSKYNYISYCKLYRRNYQEKISIKKISEYFNIAEQDIYKMQHTKYMEIEDDIF